MHQHRFCPTCGEKRWEEDDRKVWHFIQEVFAGITSLDNKALRTLGSLFFKPGHLSLAFSEGKKKPYWLPFQLFLIINLFYFLFFSAADIFFNYWPYALKDANFGIDLNYFANKALAERGMSAEVFARNFNQASINHSKAWLFLGIPFTSVFSFVLFGYWRRYFVDHLVFVTHLISFLLGFMFCWIFLISKIIGIHKGDILFAPIEYGFYLYTFLATRTYFKLSWWWALPTSFILANMVYFFFFNLYRTLIAIYTAWSI